MVKCQNAASSHRHKNALTAP